MAEESSSKRDSIWSTSCSTMPASVGPSRLSTVDCRLSDDFHPDAILLGRGVGVLDREHGLQRRDRDGELREVGLARGELLELHPGPHEDLRPALVALLAEQLDQLEREARHQRDAEDAGGEEPVP